MPEVAKAVKASPDEGGKPADSQYTFHIEA
eukprot:SAG31_NODE_46952_length_252_cov_0.679739_1_plen_29_part_10